MKCYIYLNAYLFYSQNTLPNYIDSGHGSKVLSAKIIVQPITQISVRGTRQAQQMIQHGYDILMHHATLITDPAQRQSYLERVPKNHDLIRAYRAIMV